MLWRAFPLSQRIYFIDCRKTTDLIMCYSTQPKSPFRVQKLFYVQEVLISIPVLQSVNLRDASLGAYSQNWEKATISSFMFVLPSVHMEQLGYYWTDFYEILYLGIFSKICREESSFTKNLIKITETLLEDQHAFCILRRMRNVSDMLRYVAVKTQILCSVTFPCKSCRWWDNAEKSLQALQEPHRPHWWHCNTALALCMLGNWDYRHTHAEYVIIIAFPRQQWSA